MRKLGWWVPISTWGCSLTSGKSMSKPDGLSKLWFECRHCKNLVLSTKKFCSFFYGYICGTMVCLRRPLSLRVVIFCCCLFNCVGLIHSFIHLVKEGEVFDVFLRFKYHRFIRLHETLGWHAIVCFHHTWSSLWAEASPKGWRRMSLNNFSL